MEKKIIATDKYFSSGLYCEKAFYKIHEISNQTLEDDWMCLHYNNKLLSKAWNMSDMEDVDERFRDSIDYEYPYEPRKFDEEVAIKCGLIPFVYDRSSDDSISLLVGWKDLNSRERLDAYQVLTDKTIDRESTFFTNKERFTSIVGNEIVAAMEKILYEAGK